MIHIKPDGAACYIIEGDTPLDLELLSAHFDPDGTFLNWTALCVREGELEDLIEYMQEGSIEYQMEGKHD